MSIHVMRSVRLPIDLATDLDTLAARTGADFSTVTRRFLRQRADQALASTATGRDLLEQPELFARGGTARRNGRTTERKAAADVAPRAGSQRLAVLELFAVHDAGGLTTDEVCRFLPWAPVNGLARRVTDLLEVGALEEVLNPAGWPVTRKTRAGADAQVWRITDKGRAWLR